MKASPFDLQGKGAIHSQPLDPRAFPWSSSAAFENKEGPEPRSVLDHIRSPSPPSSTSTLSSSLADPTALAALSDNNPSSQTWPVEKREEWVPELQPIPMDMGFLGSHKCGFGTEDWESMLDPTAPAHDQSFLKWVMSDMDDPKQQQMISQQPMLGDFEAAIDGGCGGDFGAVDSGLSFDHISISSNGKAPLLGNSYSSDIFLSPGMFSQEPPDEKPQIFGNNLVLPPQNPSFFLPFSPFAFLEQQQPPPQQQLLLPPPAKRPLSMANPSAQTGHGVPNTGQDPFLGCLHAQLHQGFGGFQAFPSHSLHNNSGTQQQQQQQQQQELIDQLFKAAELIEGGSSVNAQGILARLNHQLSPVGKPLIRSAFCFMEALNATVSGGRPPTQTKALGTPLDMVLKISAYKSFSEISPVLQFTNFTCVQTLLEELAGCDRIHIIDFDIGVGGQWSSFMQELSLRRAASATNAVSLKITAFVSPSSYHPLELVLTRDSLAHFASDLNIPFEFNVLSLDSFDSAAFNDSSHGDEAIAVSIPNSSSYPLTPALLRGLKQLSPKIVVSVDHGCVRCELPFSQNFLNLLRSHTALLESIDAACANLDVTNKIERLLLQPRIEGAVLGRYRITNKMLPWRTMFTSSGFVPVPFSNFTETQAECLLKRIQVRGFHVEKRQSSLVLFWQRGEIVSVSAWRC